MKNDYVDIFSSRRDYFEECEYWLRKDSENPNELIYNVRQSDGFFDAKLSNPETFGKDVIGGVFMFDTMRLTLETRDDIRTMRANDIVKYNGVFYMVEDIQKRPQRKNTQFHSDITYIYYISLRG